MQFFLRVAAVAAIAALGRAASNMPLTLLTDAQGKTKGAVCLDGTNPGFYHRAASDSTSASKWVLYFKGGGWCYDEDSCAQRAKSELGSNKYFPKTFGFNGVLDTDPTANPDFAEANHVVLWYCDGASFSGDKTNPYHYAKTNQTLYFRGRRVLDAILDVLMGPEYGLSKATEVLLSGGSAGGLSTYLHADYIRTKLPRSVTKYKAAPVSGFFLLHDNANGVPVYPNEMKYVFNMQNSTNGVNAACIESLPTEEQWRCIFANYSYASSKTPMFPMQSALDSWQMGSIWQGDKGCTSAQFQTCTAAQIQDLNGYEADFMRDLTASPKYGRAGEGGFVESCLEHVAAQGSAFNTYKINGVTVQEALGKWWNSDGTEAPMWHLPCKLSATEPHQCNPTC